MTTTERADLHAAVDAFLDGKPVEERNTNPDTPWRPLEEGEIRITAGVLYRPTPEPAAKRRGE